MQVWLAPSAYAPSQGGVEQLTAQLGARLHDAGHDVTVITNRHPADLPDRETVLGLPVVRLPFASPRRSARACGQYLRSLRAVFAELDALAGICLPDLVHVHCPSSQTAAVTLWCRRRGIPLVLTTHGETSMDAGQIYQRSRYLRTVLRFSAGRASALTGCSSWALREAAKVAPAFAGGRVILNAVDGDEWRDVGPPNAELVIAAWGRLVPQKGFDLLLDAFAVLHARLPQTRLLIGGDGPEAGALRIRGGEGVSLLGPLDRAGVGALLAACRIVAVPSRVEPFGLVALEAVAAGRQVVYAANTGLAEALDGLGVATDVFDAEVFATNLEQALNTPPDAQAAAQRLGELSWPKTLRSYLDVYDMATARGAG